MEEVTCEAKCVCFGTTASDVASQDGLGIEWNFKNFINTPEVDNNDKSVFECRTVGATSLHCQRPYVYPGGGHVILLADTIARFYKHACNRARAK
ncbi:hypothetical protein KQX54_004856 [Cotesia glomerata]|uniref:Uncharacterized protein n=1 Tax=Cotesia glomerata TaxID=32391 RepID=A0AAV7I0V6_COTGL|nr:hypothetical protein KQX54_004856 [Cotesia glomerata]